MRHPRPNITVPLALSLARAASELFSREVSESQTIAYQYHSHSELNESHWHILLITSNLDVDRAILAEDFRNCSLKFNLVMLAIQAENSRISHGIIYIRGCTYLATNRQLSGE